jgi:hypothetical protein
MNVQVILLCCIDLIAVVKTLINAKEKLFNNRQKEEYSNEEDFSIRAKNEIDRIKQFNTMFVN